MNLKSSLRKIGLWFHEFHNNAYSYYKIKELDVYTVDKFTAYERIFYLQFHCILQGQSLVIYDIGAANGIVSSCFAKLANVAVVEAFEPIPEVYNELLKTTKTYSKIRCHNIALGKTEDSLPMYINHQTDTSSFLQMDDFLFEEFPGIEINKVINVPIFQLDGYVKKHNLTSPNIIKIDVQGYEMNVLEGGIETIVQAKYCVLEMSLQPLYKDSPLFDDIYRFMHQLGFKLIGLISPLTGDSNIQLQLDGIFENQRSI
jgi:FkbM family methyltransferase